MDQPLSAERADRTGVVHISRIPPLMSPSELRSQLAPFGAIGRVYLVPASAAGTKRALPKTKACRFVEGWVEFLQRRDAKTAALALNSALMGGKKSSRFHDEIWAIKYLPKFKWSHLSEKKTYENAVREQRMRTEAAQAKRENNMYVRQVEKAQLVEQIRAKKRGRTGEERDVCGEAAETMEALRQRFRQRRPAADGE